VVDIGVPGKEVHAPATYPSIAAALLLYLNMPFTAVGRWAVVPTGSVIAPVDVKLAFWSVPIMMADVFAV
jgi:hypothetical protein